jgi:hypothetical protein
MESKQKVRKELRTERPSIYSFEIEEMKSWLIGKRRKAFPRRANIRMAIRKESHVI